MRLPLLALLALHLSAQVRINEIQIRPDRESGTSVRNHQWVELWNPAEAPVDLAGWKLTTRTGLTGEAVIELPALVLPPDHYLVVHISSGESESQFTDGAAAYFTQDDTSRDFWNPASDAIALYSPDSIVDYFAWSSRAAALDESEAAKDAIAAGIWTRGASLKLDGIAASAAELVRAALPGESLGRDATGADANSPFDFDITGGVGASLSTPGGRNYTPFLIDDEPVPFAEADEFKEEPGGPAARAAEEPPRRRKWTVMLYLACDDPTIQYVCLEYLERIYRAGGSNDDVAYVALYDGFDNLRGKLSGEDLTLLGMVPSVPESELPKYGGADRYAGERPFYLLNPKGVRDGIVIQEQNTGHPNTLGGFIAWARKNFPSDHTMLVLAGHGRGWKSFGPDLSSSGQWASYDALYLNEMRAAMVGAPVDILAFNSCLMAELEVVYQFTGKANYFLGSEEIMGFGGLDFAAIHRTLSADPGFTPEGLGTLIVNTFPEHQARTGRFGGNTLSLIDMREVPSVAAALNSFALSMRRGVPYLDKRDDLTDNAHTGMVEALVQTFQSASFGDTNLLDLDTYVRNVNGNPKIPACAKGGAAFLLERIRRAVLRQSNSLDRAGLGGLSIYYPVVRMTALANIHQDAEPYDLPNSRARSGFTRRIVYALNNDALPLKARTMELPEEELIPRTEWPAPPSPGLLFTQHYRDWPRFLERYYHPVADATILYGELPGGQRILPESIPAERACGRPTDRISLPVGGKVVLSGRGSTDWDPGDPTAQPGIPYILHWDTDSEKECDFNCIHPSAVGDGADAALTATDNLDQDRIPDDTRWDDKDQSGPLIEVACGNTARQFFVTLFPWDDNHIYPFHNTLPTAAYVHPQTDRHTAEIICTPTPGTFLGAGAQPFIQAGDRVRVDAAVTTQEGFGAGKFPIRIVSTTNTRGMTLERPDAETSSARTPPEPPPIPPGAGFPQVRLAEPQTRNPSSTILIPDGGGVWVNISGRGTFTLDFIAGNPGPASIVLDIPGLGQRTLNFTVAARLAPEPDEILIFPPGNANVGVNANLIVEPRRNGQPLQDAIVTFLAPDGNAVFTNGTAFRSGRGTQVRTGATGRTFAAIQAQVNGEVPIQILSGRLFREINVFGRGGPNTAVTRITALEIPSSLTVGARSRVVFGVFAGNERVPNRDVRITLLRGRISAAGAPAGATVFDVRTNSFGEAVLPFTVSALETLEMTATVTGAQLSTRVFSFVRPEDE